MGKPPIPAHSAAPVDDRAEDIENERLNLGEIPHGVFLEANSRMSPILLRAKLCASLATSGV